MGKKLSAWELFKAGLRMAKKKSRFSCNISMVTWTY